MTVGSHVWENSGHKSPRWHLLSPSERGTPWWRWHSFPPALYPESRQGEGVPRTSHLWHQTQRSCPAELLLQKQLSLHTAISEETNTEQVLSLDLRLQPTEGQGTSHTHRWFVPPACSGRDIPALLSTGDELKACWALSGSEAVNIKYRAGLTKPRSHLWKATAMIGDNLEIIHGSLTLLHPP